MNMNNIDINSKPVMLFRDLLNYISSGKTFNIEYNRLLDSFKKQWPETFNHEYFQMPDYDKWREENGE